VVALPSNGASELAERIVRTPPARPGWARLAALSGVDASGKGTLARATAAELERRGLGVALVGLDDWHQPPAVRFGGSEPGEHFYRHAFDFEEVFSQVVEPLRLHRELSLSVRRPHPFTGEPRTLAYDWSDVDVVLFEGVFLLRRDLRPRYDLTVWIDCPFDVALERALRRNQEGLPAAQLIEDYRRIYFPAQQFHLERDRPRESAGVVVDNAATR